MNIFGLLIGYYKKRYFKNAKKQGLKVAEDCRITGKVDFGSEPYLVEIGKHVTITHNVTFITHDGGTWVFRDQPKYKDVIKYGKIYISNNCFIGHSTIIMPGVTIGENCVIGAGSVVTKDVPPNSVYAGVPAKLIMSTEEYAEKCLKNTPDYNLEAYKKDKQQEILRMLK